MYFVRRHLPWIAGAALGLILIGAGVFLIVSGLQTRDYIADELRAEQLTTSEDSSIPGVPIDDAETAQAQADIIKEHTLGTWGPYSELPRDDPRRAQFIDGVTLRTALNMSVMGFRITDLVIGTGAIVLAAGLATLVLATPGLYFLAGMVTREERAPRV